MKTHCKRGHALTGANLRERKQHGKYVQRDCVTCLKMHHDRYRGVDSSKPYVPLDEILESTLVRVLRLLRRCDWVDFVDVCDALDIVDGAEKTRTQGMLQFLARRGYVDLHKIGGRNYFRINDSGVRKLNAALQRYVDMLDAVELSDDELLEAA